MSQQRFYPYSPSSDEAVQCEVALCSNNASWWDAVHDAVFCDFHAMAEVAVPVRVKCGVCMLMYPPSCIRNGVCVDCRSVMPLLWVDEAV